MVDKFKAEADENKLSVNEDMAENKFLDADTKGKLAAVLNYAGFDFGDRITTMQLKNIHTPAGTGFAVHRLSIKGKRHSRLAVTHTTHSADES